MLLTYFDSLRISIINIVTILMTPAKMVTLVLFKVKIFWNKGYDVIIYVHDVPTNFYHMNKIIL